MRIVLVLFSIFSVVSLASAKAPTADETFIKARNEYTSQNLNGAFSTLSSVLPERWNNADLALRTFGLGVWAFEKGDYERANAELTKALQMDDGKAAYVHYLRAQIFKSQKKWNEAQREYEKSLRQNPPKNIKYQTRMSMSEIAVAQGKWDQAYKHLAFLERRWRNTADHPQVLWNLIGVENKRNKKWQGCRWARKLFSKYPAHPLVANWSADLRKSEYNGEKVDCEASFADQRSRVQRLQWGGEHDRARKEIDQMRSLYGEGSAYNIDLVLANFLVNEGYVDEALKLLMKYSDAKAKDFNYLMLLGKAGARAGEYQTAVSAYYRASQIKPNSTAGRKALFQSAFLSYQFQDYDGAARKFEDFIKKNPSSGLVRDARWQLAWIQYLKGNYDGAIAGFKYLLQPISRRRANSEAAQERVRFWLAMAHLRKQETDVARTHFQSIAASKNNSYYSIASQFRLSSLPSQPQVVETPKPEHEQERDPASAQTPMAMEAAAVPADAKEETAEITPAEEQGEETAAEDGEAGEDLVADAPEEGEDAGVGVLKNTRLSTRFDLANDLIRLGLNEWARWELYFIEQRTRHPQDLKLLVKLYDRIGSYHRSAYIGEWGFFQQRTSLGMNGAKELWISAYPMAYEDRVVANAKAFSVPREFVWSIMRAESQYKPDAISPVGARGLMQMMPFTGKQVAKLLGEKNFADDKLFDPATNIRYCTRYLQRLLTRFEQQIPLAAAAYNAGPHRVDNWLANFGTLDMDEFIEHIPFLETRDYVKKVVRNFTIYSNLYRWDPLESTCRHASLSIL